MTRYSVQPRHRIFINGNGFLSFAKNMSKNIGKSISKNLSENYSQKLLDHAKQSATKALKTSKRVIQKQQKERKERYTSPEKRQKIIDDIRLI